MTQLLNLLVVALSEGLSSTIHSLLEMYILSPDNLGLDSMIFRSSFSSIDGSVNFLQQIQQNIIMPTAIALFIVNMVTAFAKGFFSKSVADHPEEPRAIFIRSLIGYFCLDNIYPLISFLKVQVFGKLLYTGFVDRFNFKTLLDETRQSFTDLTDNIGSIFNVFSTDATAMLGVNILIFAIILVLGWRAVQLFMVYVERYVYFFMLVLFAPLACAAIPAKSTEDIWKKYIRMLVSAALSLTISHLVFNIFLLFYAHAVTTVDVQANSYTTDHYAEQVNIVQILMALAVGKWFINIDPLLNATGLTNLMKRGAMVPQFISRIASHAVMGGIRSLGETIKGGAGQMLTPPPPRSMPMPSPGASTNPTGIGGPDQTGRSDTQRFMDALHSKNDASAEAEKAMPGFMRDMKTEATAEGKDIQPDAKVAMMTASGEAVVADMSKDGAIHTPSGAMGASSVDMSTGTMQKRTGVALDPKDAKGGRDAIMNAVGAGINPVEANIPGKGKVQLSSRDGGQTWHDKEGHELSELAAGNVPVQVGNGPIRSGQDMDALMEDMNQTTPISIAGNPQSPDGAETCGVRLNNQGQPVDTTGASVQDLMLAQSSLAMGGHQYSGGSDPDMGLAKFQEDYANVPEGTPVSINGGAPEALKMDKESGEIVDSQGTPLRDRLLGEASATLPGETPEESRTYSGLQMGEMAKDIAARTGQNMDGSKTGAINGQQHTFEEGTLGMWTSRQSGQTMDAMVSDASSASFGGIAYQGADQLDSMRNAMLSAGQQEPVEVGIDGKSNSYRMDPQGVPRNVKTGQSFDNDVAGAQSATLFQTSSEPAITMTGMIGRSGVRLGDEPQASAILDECSYKKTVHTKNGGTMEVQTASGVVNGQMVEFSRAADGHWSVSSASDPALKSKSLSDLKGSGLTMDVFSGAPRSMQATSRHGSFQRALYSTLGVTGGVATSVIPPNAADFRFDKTENGETTCTYTMARDGGGFDQYGFRLTASNAKRGPNDVRAPKSEPGHETWLRPTAPQLLDPEKSKYIANQETGHLNQKYGDQDSIRKSGTQRG